MDQYQKRKFFLAKAYKRILSRIFDMLTAAILFTAFTCIIVATDPAGFAHATSLQAWRYLLITACVLLTQLIYFCVIPFFFNRTLWMLIFRIKYHNFGNKYLFIFKAELFLSILPSAIVFIYGIILCSIGAEWSTVFFKEFRDNSITTYASIISLYKIFFTFYGVILLIVVVNTCWKNGYKNVIDYFSNSCVIDLTNKIQKPTLIKTSSPSNLPGSVSIKDLQELDYD